MAQAKRKLQEAETHKHWTVEEYLAYEMTSPVRHEYVDGQLFAMAGESKNHNRLAGRLYSGLSFNLAAGNCEAFIENVKVKVSPTRYYYPDVVVSCLEPEEGEDAYVIEAPLLIIEVLSSSTQRNDRVEKMNAYQKLAGLREYVIISQESVRLEVYRHEQAGEAWQCEVFDDTESEVTFQSVGLTLKLADIYHRVRFAEESEEEQES
ncbi:MAG: Uma2 family endonuclease [Acidobacteriota bacterium]|nr:Uma2 family endonuclease [Acidobacteriota bacterium]